MIPGDLLVWLAGLSVGAGLVELGHWAAAAARRRRGRASRARLKQAIAEGQPFPLVLGGEPMTVKATVIPVPDQWRNPLDPRIPPRSRP